MAFIVKRISYSINNQSHALCMFFVKKITQYNNFVYPLKFLQSENFAYKKIRICHKRRLIYTQI